MERICKQCGNKLSEDANYCDECGSKYEELGTTDNKENLEHLAQIVSEGTSKVGTVIASGLEKGKEKLNEFQNMSKEERQEKVNEYAGVAKEQGKAFVEDVKNFKALSKKKQKKIIAILAGGAIFMCLVFSMLFGGEYKYKSIVEFQKAFCNNIGEEYSADEWRQNSAEETGSYDLAAYEDGYGNVMLLVYYEDDEVVAAAISDDMRYLDVDTEFLWKCAAVSAMLGCDMDEADSIVREANFAHNEGEIGVEIEGGIKIFPYSRTDTNISFFMIQTERYDY